MVDKIWVVCLRQIRSNTFEPVECTYSRDRAETLALLYGIDNSGIPRAFIKLVPIRNFEYFDDLGADASLL